MLIINHNYDHHKNNTKYRILFNKNRKIQIQSIKFKLIHLKNLVKIYIPKQTCNNNNKIQMKL